MPDRSSVEQEQERGTARDVLDFIDGLWWFLGWRAACCYAGARRGWHLDPPVPVVSGESLP